MSERMRITLVNPYVIYECPDCGVRVATNSPDSVPDCPDCGLPGVALEFVDLGEFISAESKEEIDRLRRERDEAKHDVHRAQLWIASLIHLHGGQVRIPFSVLTEVARTFTRSTDPETGDEILALLDDEKDGGGA